MVFLNQCVHSTRRYFLVLRNIILCPNHRSFCDFLILSYLFFELRSLDLKLPKIAAAYEFKNIPIIGKIFEDFGCIFIKRGIGKDSTLKAKFEKLINENENLGIFIEGTRSRSRQSLPFKSGLINCIKGTGKEFVILPITYSYEKIPDQKVLKMK